MDSKMIHFKQKRSQITVFLLLALVLASLFVGFLFLRSRLVEVEISAEDIIGKTPTELRPVHNFIHDCMKRVLIDGLNKAGEHGGYINPLNEDLSDKSFNMDHYNPTDSDGVSLSGEDELFVPYWFFQTQLNPCVSCVTSSHKPTIEDIEVQLNEFFKIEFNSCTRDFSDFKEKGFEIIEEGDLKPDVQIAEKSVNFFLNYPLKVNKGGSSSLIEEFYVTVPLNFKEFYDLAEDIFEYESDVMIFENFFINLISQYSGVSPYKLPPFYEITEGYSYVIWIKPIIDRIIRHMLVLNFPYLRIEGTLNEQEVLQNAVGDLENLFFNGSILHISEQDYGELEAEFFYVNWPLFLSIRPEESGGIYKPIISEKKDYPFVPPHQINMYKFLYDVSFPILVRITQKNTPLNEPYSFWFSFEVTIKDNKNLLQWFAGNGTLNANQINTTPGVDPNDPSDIPEKILFCNDNQLLSGKINVSVYNFDDEPIKDAVVNFGCGIYSSCELGKTNEEGLISTKMPLCVGGYVSIEPPRGMEDTYFRKAVPLTTEGGIDQSIEVYLNAIEAKNISLNVLEMIGPNNCCAAERPVDDTEMIMLTVTRLIEPGEIGEPFSQTFVYDPEADDPLAIKEIKLVPGEYEVNADYFDNDGFELEKWCKHVCDGFGCNQIKEAVLSGTHPNDALHACTISPTCFVLISQWMPEDTIEIIPAPIGGAILNNDTDYWTISSNDLYSYQDDVKFYVLRLPTPTCLDTECVLPSCIGMNEMGKTINYSRTFSSDLMPRFI